MTPADYILFLIGLVLIAAIWDRLWLDVLRPRITGRRTCECERIPGVAWVVSGLALIVVYAIVWVIQ